ncbi:MAG: nuclear transport factor 2 family protein [Acidimicrobiia bacterium]
MTTAYSFGMTPADVQSWLDRYIEAWRSYDRGQIKALFAEEASYQYHPWDEPLRGADAIADDWLANQDEPGSWEASYRPLMVDGQRAITTGHSSYDNGRRYWNLWEVDFDDQGRCIRFVEWFMRQPTEQG